MKRSSRGNSRSIFIWSRPEDGAPGLRFPRRRFSRPVMPRASADMSNRPSRVRRTTSPADRQHSMASHSARRAVSAGSTARMWSSRNSMVAITMSARAISAQHSASASASAAQRSAACITSDRPGMSRRSACCACSTTPARWLSIVTRTMRRGMRSAREVRFGIVQRLDGDGGEAGLGREALRVAAGLAAHEERDLAQFLFGIGAQRAASAFVLTIGLAAPAPRCDAPASSWNSKSSRNMCSRCSSSPIISGCTQVSNRTFAPSKPICGEWRAGKSCTWTGAEITAQGMPSFFAMWRSICVPSTSSGCAAAMAASTAR